MTHGAVYLATAGVNCVIHVHSKAVFDGMIRGNYPATAGDAAFGTPELAFEIGERVKELGEEGQIVMKGHDEGVLAYGTDIKSTLNLILELYNKYSEPA
jgi:ribulose-5-phosphate 4-epimerase/fuculose-1-phosphate aldolase